MHMAKILKILTYTFADLMDDIRKIDVPRVRFTTSHPRDFDDRLIEVLGKRGNLVEHIHLPVQSGNTEVLKTNEPEIFREIIIYSLLVKLKRQCLMSC